MSEELSERINLPLTPSMYAAIKERAAQEHTSAVGFIRKCIEDGLQERPKMYDLERRVEALEKAQQAAESPGVYKRKAAGLRPVGSPKPEKGG